jgi:apyrase
MTPVFVFATAGMRLLPEKERGQIVESLKKYLEDTTHNPFGFAPDNVRVISGADEGVFGWITTNLLLGTLPTGDADTDDDLATIGANSTATVGALDMGGASAQITFLPEPGVMPADRGYDLQIGTANYSLYVHSYNGWGANEARSRARALLPDKSDPCLPVGYVDPETNYTGSGNATACLALSRDILLLDPNCSTAPDCAINGTYQPPVTKNDGGGMFYGFSSYAYVADCLGLSETVTPAEVQAASAAYCALNWTELEAKYPVGSNECGAPRTNESGAMDFRPQYCFMGLYASAALQAGFGFPANSSQLAIASSVHNVDLGWSMGAMAVVAGLLPWHRQCAIYSDCSSCTDNSGCGWCESDNRCVDVGLTETSAAPCGGLRSWDHELVATDAGSTVHRMASLGVVVEPEKPAMHCGLPAKALQWSLVIGGGVCVVGSALLLGCYNYSTHGKPRGRRRRGDPATAERAGLLHPEDVAGISSIREDAPHATIHALPQKSSGSSSDEEGGWASSANAIGAALSNDSDVLSEELPGAVARAAVDTRPNTNLNL